MRVTLLVAISFAFVALLASATGAQTSDAPIVVVEVGDPMDQRTIDYVAAALDTADAHLFILKIDSPGVSSGDVTALYDAVAGASAPVVSWVGPYPAVAYGGAAYLANHSDIRSAAPGTSVGYLTPLVQRGQAVPPATKPGPDTEAFLAMEASLSDDMATVTFEDPVVIGFVDRMDPALGQLIVSLDGEVVTRGSEAWEISTARAEEIDGQEFLVATRRVVFVKPGLADRFLHLGGRPETAFLFLVVGLAFAVFEFYAAGRGLMASVASVSLIIAGYGLATLPIWWPALILILIGLALMVWGFSLNRVDWRAAVGTLLLLVGGLSFTTSRPAYPPGVPMVVLSVAASVVFIWYSLTAVVRGRFATPTIGREDLIGRHGLAVSDLAPTGVVLLGEGRWEATADRGIIIKAGVPVEIVGLTGLVLEVDPIGLSCSPKGREEI